jgi:hypothetical protein
MWNNAMRACDVAGLKVQRAALEADWKLVRQSLTLTSVTASQLRRRRVEPATTEFE